MEEDGEERWWAHGAQHQPADFRAFFDCTSGATLRYHFHAGASQLVPPYEPPSFKGVYKNSQHGL